MYNNQLKNNYLYNELKKKKSSIKIEIINF